MSGTAISADILGARAAPRGAVARPWRRGVVAVVAFLFVVAGLLAPSAPAEAARKPYDDKRLGYRIKIDSDWVIVPPKLTSSQAYLVGEWYVDEAKYDSALRPEFKVCWWAKAKGAAVTGSGLAGLPTDKPPTEDEMRKAMMDEFRADSIDEYADQFLERNTRLFGPFSPTADRWKTAKKMELPSPPGAKRKNFVEYVEINVPDKRSKEPKRDGYAVVARAELDRPGETVNVAFMAYCGTEHAKKLRDEFLASIKSFEDLRTGTDTLNHDAERDLSDDPEKFRTQVKESKVVKGWKSLDTKNYLLVYAEEVDAKLVHAIATQIEGIRAQVYEVLFPPDKPIKAVSVVRICKDRDQYFAYGGPGGSAGYWASGERELVFYEMDGGQDKDALAVLRHEAFHQYIFYSVGDFSPHSWFNEGHGDYFAGHRFVGGKFVRDEFDWRTDLAKSWKRKSERPPLAEWLTWDQSKYYGRNNQGVDAGANYALGWSFIYFLRKTKNPTFQKILPTYFDVLKGKVTAARDAAANYEKAIEEWQKKQEADPANTDPRPEYPRSDEEAWLKEALQKALDGVDVAKLEKEWLDD